MQSTEFFAQLARKLSLLDEREVVAESLRETLLDGRGASQRQGSPLEAFECSAHHYPRIGSWRRRRCCGTASIVVNVICSSDWPRNIAEILRIAHFRALFAYVTLTTIRKWLFIVGWCFAILGIASTPQPAWAWGDLGHEVIA